ncbi:MAG TPA: hypothetical protein EYG94_05470, partial [Campylobacterales bacterium]|nr:hypothetical protein [Campylobacterales bacterium]
MKLLLLIYSTLRWLILLVLLLVVLLFFVLNSPAPFLKLLKEPLAEQGINYSKLEGGFLTGFKLSDVNYDNKVKAKSVALKVDYDLLKERVLYVEYLELEDAQIDKAFLRELIDANATKEEKNESNVSLPFDKVIVKKLIVSLQNTGYENYHVNHAKITVNDFETDMKTKHKGELKLLLDSNVSQIDLSAKIKDDKYELEGSLIGERLCLNPLVRESDLTFLSNPKFYVKATGDMKRVNYSLTTKALDLKFQAYDAETKVLNISGYYDLNSSDVKTKVKADIDANVARLTMTADAFVNLNDINNSLVFEFETLVNPKENLLQEAVIQEELAAQNIQVLALPKVVLFAKGNMQHLDFKSNIKNLKLRKDDIDLDLKVLDLKGESQVLKGDVKVALLSNFDSTFGRADIKADAKLNYKDINNTLAFTLKTDFKSNEKMKSIFLAEQNLSIEKIPSFTLLATGDMKKLDFETKIEGLKVKQEKISLELKHLALTGSTEPLKGDTVVKLSSDFDSSIAKGVIFADAKFNFNKLEETLDFEAKTDLAIYDAYLNPLLKENDLILEGNSLLNMSVRGSLTALQLKADLSSTMIKEKIRSKIELNTEDIFVNLKEEQIRGAFTLKSDASNLALNLQSNFSGNYMKPEELKTDSKLQITAFNAFGVNLTAFMPLTAELGSDANGGKLNLFSKKLNLKAQSEDYDHVSFEIKSEKIFPSKIIDLPKELKSKFVKIDLKGDATISKQYFSLKGFLEANKNFKVNVMADSKEEGLNVNLFSKHFKLNAKGDLNEKKIKAVVEIDSLAKLQEELQALYKFSAVEVDGALKLNASLDGEKVKATISSKKLAFEAFAIEDLDIDTNYSKDLLTINKLDFKTTGFEQEKLNQHYYLNKKGTVHLGEKRDVYLDIHPNILVKATGTSENLEAAVQIESLALGHPDYGDFILSCDIDYKQEGKKKKILGAIFIDKMKLHYESKFLDPSQDNDVIIVSKKDKNKKEQGDLFLEDTFIDLFIYVSEANYKTKDIDLKFMVDLKAKKDFGKPLGMFGKIKEINGRVEQAPKLFTVIDSNIVFKGGKEINPLLDIEVEYELPDVLITINIHGNAKRPKLSFSSEPPLPKKDILSYLLLGVSTANLGKGQGSLGREAQLFIMNQAARDLAYEVELDRVFVKDDGTGEGYAIQVGKKIQDDTMIIIE